MFDDFNISQWTISPPQRTHRTPWNFNISRKSWDQHMPIHYTQVPSSTMGRQWVSPYGALPRLTTSRARVGSRPRRGGKTDGKLRRQRPFPRTLSATTDAALGIRRAGNLQVQPFFMEEKVKLKAWLLWWITFQVQGDCVKSPQTTKTNKKQWNWRDFYKMFIILEGISATFMSHSNALLYHQQRNHFWFSQS